MTIPVAADDGNSLRTQILRLRNHASIALWMNGSDNAPPANVETAYRKLCSSRILADRHRPLRWCVWLQYGDQPWGRDSGVE